MQDAPETETGVGCPVCFQPLSVDLRPKEKINAVERKAPKEEKKKKQKKKMKKSNILNQVNLE